MAYDKAIRGYSLGDVVTFDKKLQRQADNNSKHFWWDSKSVDNLTGVVVGHRTLRNGKINTMSDWNEFSGKSYTWNEFVQEEAVPCLLVAVDMRKNHVYVPFDGIVDNVKKQN